MIQKLHIFLFKFLFSLFQRFLMDSSFRSLSNKKIRKKGKVTRKFNSDRKIIKFNNPQILFSPSSKVTFTFISFKIILRISLRIRKELEIVFEKRIIRYSEIPFNFR